MNLPHRSSFCPSFFAQIVSVADGVSIPFGRASHLSVLTVPLKCDDVLAFPDTRQFILRIRKKDLTCNLHYYRILFL
jgi:hypothetical protein